MLIEFSVQNHRAFREKQTFSMVAGAATERSGGRVAHTDFSAAPYVLLEACIFGANGSGKSSLIDAMNFMSDFVRNSFRRESSHDIRVAPFLFHSEWREKPSEFEIIFIHQDILYQYGFSLNSTRVLEEWLFARPKSTGRERLLFTRTYDPNSDSYGWDINSVQLKGERDSWKTQTRADALFLSTAVQLNAEGLKGPYEWLVNRFKRFSMTSEPSRNGYTARRFTEAPIKAKVIKFLRDADIIVHDIEVEQKNFLEDPSFMKLPPPIQDIFKENPAAAKVYAVSFFRQDDQKSSIPLPLHEESSGTKALFELAAPIIDVLENGYTVVIDELNSGLHPLAFQQLIAMFSDPEINQYDAQLIFTTHDTSVTESNCIERDQIWLVEKNDDLAARLIPFSDFKTRNAHSFQKSYLQGRYGAVPRIFD